MNRWLLEKIKKDSKKIQEDLEFFIQAYEKKCLEEEDKKEIKKDITELRNDLNNLKRCIEGIAIIHKR